MSSTDNASSSLNADLLLDRFVSASTAQDAHASLESILQGLVRKEISAASVFQDVETPRALLQVLQTSHYKDLPVEEGSSLAAQITLQLVKDKNAPVLTEPSPGRFLEVLIDVASDDTMPTYPRVLCLQALLQLCQQQASAARQQLLQAPNGLTRLGDLLKVNVDEQVRNEALLLAAVVAEWSAAAKVWMFHEVGDVVIQLALQEGGLTNGNVLVLDCLKLLKNLLKHDGTLAVLVFQSNLFASGLTRLLDLRLAAQFLNPPKPSSSKAAEDDLDDLISSGSSKDKKQQEQVVPKLTSAEEDILQAVMDILAIVLDSESLRTQVWKQHSSLVTLVWEMALIVPPPPGIAYPCAIPSPQLQQRALQVTAQYLNDPGTMERLKGLDRLLYLVCTGAMGTTLLEKLSLSQSALHVIRQTLSTESAHEMLLHSMAPPMEEEEQQQPRATVVQKLLNTVFENLVEPKENEDRTRRKVFLSGATSALTLFVTDEASRSMLLRMTSKPSLVDGILESLVENEEAEDDFIVLVLLRFLAQWIMGAPVVVHSVLASPQSTVLSTLFASKNERVSALSSLVLGLAMTYMGADESKCGGWTGSSIMEMITKRGVSRFTSKLEKFKSLKDAPWSACQLEWKIWSKWYDDSVLQVRKRVVQELTAGEHDDERDGGQEEGDGTTTTSTTSSGSAKSLQLLVAQQAEEIDELRRSLSEAQNTIASQEKQLSAWKKRVESTPTQLDEMLSEYTSKNADLEQMVGKLQEEIRVKDEKHKSDLSSRDEAIDAVKMELGESQVREDEARQERDSLREELTALSQAYSSLEDDYRREQTSSAAGAASGEQEDASRQQPEGEVSEQMPTGSTEVATLRADNTRLRKDAKAADEWMAMAVERMNAIGSENAGLQQEVASLKSQLESTQSEALLEERDRRLQLEAQLSQASETAEQTLHEERRRREVLEAELEQSAEVSKKLHDERLRREELESQLANSHADVQSAMDSLGKAKSVREELERSVEALMGDLESARLEIATLRQGQEGGSSFQSDVPAATERTAEVEALEASLASLQNELAASKTELESTKRREQEEIYQREARIRDLESRLGGGLGGYTVEDIRTRDEEIAQLRESNEAAQEWMAKAVEHHQLLSDQLATLTREKSSLHAEVKDLSAKVAVAEAAVNTSRLDQLESDLKLRTCELDDAKSELAMREERIVQLQSGLEVSMLSERDRAAQYEAEACVKATEIEELTASNRELVDKLTRLESLQAEFDAKEEELQQLRRSGLKEKMEQVQANYDRLAEERDALTEQAKQLKGDLNLRIEEIRQLKEEMDRRAKENASAELVLSDQDEDMLHRREEQVAELENTVESLREQLKHQEKDANNVIAQWQESYTAMEKSKAELESRLEALEGEKAELLTAKSIEAAPPLAVASEEQTARLADCEAKVKDLEDQLQEQAKNANNVIAEWRESYAAMEARKNELESRLEGLEKEKDELLAAETAASDQPGRQTELEAKVKSLEDQLEEQEKNANSAIAEWQESYTAVETSKNELESRLGALEQEKVELLATASNDSEDKSQRINELESKVKSLDNLLEDQQKSANNVIAEWQESYTAVETRKKELELRVEDLEKEKAELLTAESTDSEDKNLQIVELESKISTLEEQLVEQEKEANNIIAEWQQSYTAMETSKTELESRLQALEEEKAEVLAAESASSEYQSGRLAELEAKVKSLEEQLEGQEKDSNNVIAEWQERYSAMETSKKKELVLLVEELEKEKVELLAAEAADSEDKSLRIVELESKVSTLEEQLAEEEKEANNVIAEWQESYTAVETSKNELELRVEELKKSELLAAESADSEEKSLRIAELESKVSTLEEQLAGQEKEANNVIAEWQQSYTAMETSKTELESRLQELEEEKAEMLAAESDASGYQSGRLAELEAKVKSLEEQLEGQEKDSNNVIAEWQERYSAMGNSKKELVLRVEELEKEKVELLAAVAADSEDKSLRIVELESKVSTLEEQLAEEEKEANNVIAEWQESYTAVETSKNELELRVGELEKKTELFAAESADSEEKSLRIVELESKVSTLEAQLVEQERSAEDAIRKWEESYATSDARVKDLESQLQALKQQHTDVDSPDRLKEQVEGLKAQVTKVERQLAEQQKNSSEAITQWEESCAASEANASELERQLQQAEDELQRAKEALQMETYRTSEMSEALEVSKDSVNAAKGEIEALKSSIQEKESEIKILESDIRERDNQSLTLRSEGEAACHRLEDRVSELEEEANELTKQCEELQVALRVAERKVESEKTANDALLLKYEESEAQLVEAVRERDALQEELSSFRAQLKNAEQAHIASREQLTAAQKELEDFTRESEDIVCMWRERVEELEELNRNLEAEVDAQGQEANEAISHWESRCMELEQSAASLQLQNASLAASSTASMMRLLQKELRLKQRLLKLAGEHIACESESVGDENVVDQDAAPSYLERLQTELELHNNALETCFKQFVSARNECSELKGLLENQSSTSGELEAAQKKIVSLEESLHTLQKEKATLDNKVKVTEEKLLEATSAETDHEQNQQLVWERDELRVEIAAVEEEKERLSALVRELEDELREASDAMQLHITNEVSDKANEIAAEALRQQVDELRCQSEAEQRAYREEHEVRVAAEAEVNLLKADLTALLGMEDTDETHSEIRLRTMQAAEHFQRKERSEIEELKKALSQALDELSAEREALAEAESRVSSANLQASMYGQEIVTAQTDLRLLKEQMDDMRATESSTREAMEYRIKSLLNDQSVARRDHASQIENLENELIQVNMERDRLFQSLKDSERNKEALLRAKSGSDAKAADGDLQVELTKLRLEKAQLLVAASEEATRVERRIREAQAAEKSSSEAEVILERELRLAAEKVLENVKLEMCELRMEVELSRESDRDRPSGDDMKKQLDRLKEQTSSLREENAVLLERLDNSKKEAQEKIHRLTEECRLAKARASQLEREGRLEAEIQAEVARLRAQAANGSAPTMTVCENPAENGHDDEEIPVAQLYDIIQKQKQSIDEERAVYSELLSEHDDLLALLAQHDLVRATLNAALAEAGGQGAVDAAMREAEEKAVVQYGKFEFNNY